MDNLAVGESVPAVGTPFSLVYMSDRVVGRKSNYKISLPLVGSTTEGLSHVKLNIKYAGREFEQTFEATPNLSYDFIWDGKDSNGNLVEGTINALVTITNIGPGGEASASKSIKLGAWNVAALGLGAWSLNEHHYYDVNSKRLYFGEGRSVSAEGISYNGGYLLTNTSGSEAYVFDSSGKHLQTKNVLTGDVKYIFNYSDNKLSSVVDAYGNTTLVSQNQIVSSYGQITKLGLDENGYLKSITNPNNETHRMTYTSDGLLLTFQKPGGQTTTMTYDSFGFLVKDQGAGGNFLSLIREATEDGWRIKTSTAEGRESLHEVTSNGVNSSRKSINSMGLVSTSVSEPQGTSSSQSANGLMSSTTSSPDPRFGALAPYSQLSVTSVTETDLSLTTEVTKEVELLDVNDLFSLQKIIYKTKVQNDESKVFISEYNAQNRSTTMTSAEGRKTYITLDNKSQISKIQNADLIPTEIKYDQRGRASVIENGPRKTKFFYDSLGNLNKIQDPQGKVTQFKHDLSGRVIGQINPSGYKTKYKFDGNGNLVSLTPAGKPAHKFNLNLFELVETYLPPFLSGSATNTNYNYNLDKQITQINRPDGKNILYNYNQVSGNLESISSSDGASYFTYNLSTGQLEKIVSPDQVGLEYTYKGPLLSSVTSQLGTLQSKVDFSYNSDFSLAATSINGAESIKYEFDKDGLPVQIGKAILSNNHQGLIKEVKLEKINQILTHNSFGEIVSDQYKLDDKKILKNKKLHHLFHPHDLKMEYGRDLSGRVVEKTQVENKYKKSSEKYVYNSSGALEGVYKNNRLQRAYKYDSNNNRVQKIENGRIIKAKYDEQDRLLEYGKLEFKYNENGELIEKIEYDEDCDKRQFWNLWKKYKEKPRRTFYSYDVFGHLKSVTLPNGKKIEYVLDGQNRRVAKKVNGKIVQGYIYQSQLQVAALTDGSGKIVSQFVYTSKSNSPDYIISEGETYKVMSDQVGTPIKIVNSNTGKVIQEFNFDEFGMEEHGFSHHHSKHSQKSIMPFGFAGGLYDKDTGLVHFGAREYDPEIGRWISKDPIGFRGGDTNLMSYVSQDPINKIDPKGTTAYSICVANVHGSCLKENLNNKSCEDEKPILIDFIQTTINSFSCMTYAAHKCGELYLNPNQVPLTEFNKGI